jgi:hypothetical protein
VQRRGEIGPTESFRDDAEDLGDDAVHRIAAIHAHDRPDADRRVERRPEVELVRSIGATLGGDDPAEDSRH